MQLLAANNAHTTLASGIGPSDTTITVTSGTASRFPSPVAGTSYFLITLVDATTGQNREIVQVTAVSGNNFTIVRAQEGTTALSWVANDICACLFTAGTFNLLAQTTQTNAYTDQLKSDLASSSSGKGANLIGYSSPKTGSVSETVAAVLKNNVWVTSFGAIGDGVHDDTAAINLAIAALPSGGTIMFPAGKFLHTSAINITSKIIYLVGKGRGVTVLFNTGATSDGLVFNLNFAQGGGVQGISITAKNASGDDAGPGSTGTALSIINSNDNFHCDDFECLRYDTGVALKGCYQPYFSNFRILYFRNSGVHLLPYTAASGEAAGNGSQFTIGKIGNNGFTGDSSGSIGMLIEYGSGEFFSDIDVQKAGYGIIIKPNAAGWVRHLWMNNILGDTSDNSGWQFDQTAGGDLRDMMLNNCWSSYSGGAGVVIKGNPSDIRWQGGTIRDNSQLGVQISGGSFISFDNATINNNGMQTTLTYDGIGIDGSCNNLSINGCTIGNLPTATPATTLQANGIRVYTGVSLTSFRLTNNDLTSYGTGKAPLLLSGTATATGIFSGNLPLQTKGLNTTLREMISLNSVTTIAAGATSYIATYGQTTQVNAAAVLLKAGVITQILIGVSNNPGTTFTYTVIVNAARTAAGTITGSNFTVTTELNIPVNDGDNVFLEVVTASGSTPAIHRAAIVHTV